MKEARSELNYINMKGFRFRMFKSRDKVTGKG